VRIRAALFNGPGRGFEVREIEAEEPRDDEVLVRMSAVGVCGSDLHVVKGEWPRPTPIVLGHEGAGVVEAVGADVADVAVGQHVVLSWAPACGECPQCRRCRPAACEPLQAALARGTLLDGSTRLSLEGEPVYRNVAVGAFAERVVMPASAALPLPDGVPLEEAALLGCAALTGVGAVVNAAQMEPGACALVIGAGAVGLFVVQGARLANASVVVAVDPVAGRRRQTLSLGATHAAHPDELKALMRELMPEGADYAFDAVGMPATTSLAMRWTRGGGTCVAVGMAPAGARLDLDPWDFTSREKTLTGTVYGSEDPAVALPSLIEHVREGRLELASLLGPRYPLERTGDAVDAALAGEPGRVLVTP
jgi:S-(hydroxymethyl)glutathione dehydrogenase/alcohol dehydrogenase